MDRDPEALDLSDLGGHRPDLALVAVARHVEFEADADEVWALLDQADELADWLGFEVVDDATRPGAGLAVGDAFGLAAPDGTVHHVLVTAAEGPRRLAWHWWREGGEVSTVEITVEPADGAHQRVRVVETLALAASGQGGLARSQLAAAEDELGSWSPRLDRLGLRLARRLGVAACR